MGDQVIIRQEEGKTRCTTDLAQPRNPGIEVGEGGFQHLAMVIVPGGFELLNHSGAG